MQDILIDLENDADELVVNGDFTVGNSDEQQTLMILASSPGDWKEHPETGAALNLAKNGAIDRDMIRNIRVQLNADGFTVNKLDITTDGIRIDGQY